VKEKGAQRGGGEHAPWFVARKDIEHNTLWVVQGHDHPWLLSSALDADDVSWTPAKRRRRAAMPRRRATGRPMRPASWARAKGGFGLDFDDPQWAVTPGQSAVLYDGEVCLGGGVIVSSPPDSSSTSRKRPSRSITAATVTLGFQREARVLAMLGFLISAHNR
jgi:tRNA-specific 2-thiouridylase